MARRKSKNQANLPPVHCQYYKSCSVCPCGYFSWQCSTTVNSRFQDIVQINKGLPQMSEKENEKLDAELPASELHGAVQSLESSKAFGLDGLFLQRFLPGPWSRLVCRPLAHTILDQCGGMESLV